jgi:hypothetical protein
MPKFELILTLRSIEEIQHAVDYYNHQQPGLGKRFYAEVKRQFSLLRQNPFTRSIRYDDIRFAVLNKFLYSIHYNIEVNLIIIQGVLSDFLDPETNWIKPI